MLCGYNIVSSYHYTQLYRFTLRFDIVPMYTYSFNENMFMRGIRNGYWATFHSLDLLKNKKKII